MDTDHAETPPTPDTPNTHSSPPSWLQEKAITTATSLAVEPSVQSTFRGRRPSIRDLAPE
jgi:hypothetical protein